MADVTATLASARSNASNASASLSFQQASELNARKDLLKEEHIKYVEEHPELKQLMSDFISQLLLMKPNDIHAFAKDHFAAYLPVETQNAPLCLAGPSGVGKGSLVKMLFQEYGDKFGLSVSHTTRRPREGEIDGTHYHFTTVESMQESIDKGMFIEFAKVHSNMYGTSVQAVQDVQNLGKICILEIDVQGVKAVRKTNLNPKCIYIAPPSFEILEERLRSRGTETETELEQRLANAKEEMSWLDEASNADKKIVNDSLEHAYDELKQTLRQWYPTVFGGQPVDASE